MKKTMPLLMAVLTMILILGFAAPASAADYDVSDSTEFGDALVAVSADDLTIKLLNDIDYSGSVTIAYNITFELNGYNLTVTNASGTALIINSGKELLIEDGGEFNLIGGGEYINTMTVNAGGKATVTNVNHTYAGNGTAVVINSGSDVTITGSIVAVCKHGALNANDSTVFVGGDVITTNTDGGNYGVVSGGGSVVYIDGALRVPAGVTPIQVDNLKPEKNEYDASGTYLRYTGDIYPSYVYLLAVCEIVGSDYYNDLADALDDVDDGETIKLLTNINYNTGIYIAGISITFDVNDFILNVTCLDDNVTGNGDALEVDDDGMV